MTGRGCFSVGEVMHIQNYDLRIIDHDRDGREEELLSALTRHLLKWWHGFDGRLPGYADFDIAEHLSLADNIFLVRVINPDTFEIRLCGEVVSEVIGSNNMGRVIRTQGLGTDADSREDIRLARYYRTIVQTRRSYICFGRLLNRYDLVKRFESVDCPLFNDRGEVSHIIGVLVPIPVAPAKNKAPVSHHIL